MYVGSTQLQFNVLLSDEPRVYVDGGLIGQNMPFTLSIQTPWQMEMMIKHGHQGGVVIDATFGTNEKKVIHYVSHVIHAHVI